MRAVAFSQVINGEEPAYAGQKPYIAEVLRLLMDEEAPGGELELPKDPSGICWTPPICAGIYGQVVASLDPMGPQALQVRAEPLTGPDEHSDRWAVEQNFVSMTPLRLNLTDEEWLRKTQAEGERASTRVK